MLPSTLKLNQGCPVCAMAALLATGVSAAVLDILAPGPGPLVQPLSFHAHTGYAWLLSLTVGAGAAGLLLLAWSLRRRAVPPVFTMALTVAGLGLTPAALFSADPWFPWERLPTLSGGLHVGAVGLFILALSAAVILRPRSLPMRGAWRWCRIAEAAYWGAVLGGGAYLSAVIWAGHPPRLIGLWQRLVLGGAWAWSTLLAAGALRLKDR